MIPSLFEIYDARVKFGMATYARPCVIVSDVKGGYFSAVPLSSALQLYRGMPFHFLIDSREPDFKATGLKYSSYAAGDEFVELHVSDLIHKRGKLESDTLVGFKNWIV